MLKKFHFYMLFFISVNSLFAAPVKTIPEWMTALRDVYSDEIYLAQKGSGKKIELAKNDALSNLARYFQTTVESNLSTSFSSIEDGKDALQKTEILNTVNLSSSLNIFGVEYSEPYYSKKEKLYYCVAYVDREYAWKIFEPSILKEKRLFYEYLNEADSQAKKEPLLASKYYVEAKKKGDIFVAVLDYGRLINEEKERQYKDDRNNVASIPKKQKDIKESAVIFIVVNNDSNNIVSANLEKLLSDSGFIISKQKEKALYIVEVEINQNITIEDAGTDVESFVSLPDLNINISNISSGRSIFSSAGKTTKKSIAYSRENVLKKALPLLNEEIIYSFVQGLNAMIDGY